MSTLLSVDLPGRSSSGAFQMRWGSHISLLAVLAMVFITPHAPSTRLDPSRVGGDAMKVGGGGQGASVAMRPATSQLTPSRVAKPVTMQAAGALLRGEEPKSLLPGVHLESLSRLLRCASARPKVTAKVVVKSSVATARSAIFDDSSSSISSSSNLNASAWGLYTTVEELRSQYGTGRNLNAAQTRDLYHSLLPTSLLDDEDASTLPERASIAIAARRAARLYARERAILPVTLSSELMDGVRTLLKPGGKFQPGGMSEEQIWQKYAGCVPREGEHLDEEIYHTIISKACTSNKAVDDLCAMSDGAVGMVHSAADMATFAANTASEYGI